MTAATERPRDRADSHCSPDPPRLSQELVRCLGLMADLPGELTIAEVAEASGISAHTLRYYERIGLVEVGRDNAGHRRYDRDALARVVFVTRLRASDMPIRTIRRYVELVRRGSVTEPERLALMQAHRATIQRRLQEMQAALAVIDYKIDAYGGSCGT